MASSGGSENFLKIGDIISLKVLKYSAYLSSEGVLVNELGVSGTTLGFGDHLFQVCIQLQYSASNGFEEFLSSYEGDLGNIKDKEVRKHFGALTRGKDNEIRMNENFMRQKYGTVVKFGETIQLRHVKSSKFLTVINGELARDERENLSVALTQDGSMDSWLQFIPRFKINKEGDKIPNGSEVLMKVSERMGEFIHCSERTPPMRRLREVNSSVDSQTPWRLTIFTSILDQLNKNIIDSAPKDVKEKDVICGGDIIIIRDPETRSVLMPFSEKIQCVIPRTASAIAGDQVEDGEFDNTDNDSRSLDQRSANSRNSKQQTNRRGSNHDGGGASAGPSIQSLQSFKDITEVTEDEDEEDVGNMSDLDDENVSVASAEEFSQEHGDVVLRPMEDDKLDSNALWVIESKTIVKGGPFQSRSEYVHIRHLNSGAYIVRSDNSGCYDRCKLFKFTEKQSDARTLFQLQEIAPSKTGQLINLKVAKFRSGHYFIERDNYDDRQRIYPCFGSRNQGKAVNLIIQRYQPPIDSDLHKSSTVDDNANKNASKNAKKDSSSSAAAAGTASGSSSTALVGGAGAIDYRINDGGLRAVPLDVFVGVAARLYLAQFLSMTHVPQGKKALSVTSVFNGPGDTVADRSLFGLIIEKLILFIQGYPINATKAMLAGFVPDKKVIERRQKMFKEQGIISQLLEMLSKLKSLTKVLNLAASSQAAMSMNASSMTALTSPIYAMGKGIVVECLKLLLELIRGNPENQMYIAGHMLIILSHVIVDPLAGTVTKEMLSSNRELQETMIKFKEISIFAEQMRQQEMNSMCLQLLHACCSCQGVGIPRIQLIINQVIYEDFQDVLIQSRIDFGDGSGNPMDDYYNNSNGMENYIPVSDLYFPRTEILQDRGVMLGNTILSRGFPNVILNWVSSTNKYSAAILFGRNHVNMMDLFRPRATTKVGTMWASIPMSLAGPSSKASESQREHKQNQIMTEKKRRIAEFYSNQLLLAAELCLGRNYRIIEQMESYYPYEMLVTIMKNCANEDAKAAASKVLLCLYVDRDPQLEILIPRLCRTWSDVTSYSGSDNNSVGTPIALNRYKFGITQLILSDHLKEIVGMSFAAHTTAYLTLLHYLVKFNFFSGIDSLMDIIDPLVRLLCREGISGDIIKSQELMDQTSKTTNRKSRGNKKNKGATGTDATNNNADDNSATNVDGNDGNRLEGIGNDGYINLDESIEAMALTKDIENASKSMKDPLLLQLANEYLTSKKHLIVSLLLVLIAIGFAIFFIIYADDDGTVFVTDDPSEIRITYVPLYKSVVLAVFGAETVMRLLIHILLQRGIWYYFMNPFNVIDMGSVVLLAIAYFTHLLGPFTLFACAPRLLRLYQLITSSGNMKGIDDIVDGNIMKRFQSYTEPMRYRRTAEASIQALIEIVSIISTIQRTIQDRNVSIFLKGFYDWRANDGKGATVEQCKEIVVPLFQEACNKTEELSVSNSTFDVYYIDLLMYNNHDLVQKSLEVLMTHHSTKKFLKQNLIDLQLLVSSKREQQYSKLEVMVTQLRRDVARHDVWGRLQSDDDKFTNTEVLRSLHDLTEAIKKRRSILRFDEPYEADVTLQGILRNIGCFDMCIQMLSLRKTIDANEHHTAVNRNTKQLMLQSNALLYWFVYENPKNQLLAMAHLPTFIETIDFGIGSHKVISAIFKNNEQLMKYVPKQYIADFVNFICNNGKQVQYLSLLDSVVALDDRSLKENQYEVIRLMSSPQNIKKVVQYFVPINHPKYLEKVKLMSAYANKVDVDVEELPPDLAYHLQLIQLLSKCTVGVDGMTSIEAKVQSMFYFIDVFQALLDPQSILLSKIRLGQFIYNAFIEVEMKLPSLAEADITWKLIESTNDIFVFARDEIRQIEKNGWEHINSNRQRIEYMLTCAMIVGGFFERYYDPSIFRPDAGSTPGIERVTIKEPRAIEIIRGLFANIKNVYEMRSPLLAKSHMAILYRALVALNSANQIVATVDDLHTEEAEPLPDDDGDDSHTAQARQYNSFVSVLMENEEIQAAADEELANFITIFENLPRKADAGDNGVRFEPLLERLVSHARSCIQVVVHGAESTKYVPENKTETCIWLIRIFRLMIERKWGMTIFERDDDGGEEQDIAAAEIMTVLTEVGAPGMCLDFIARGIDPVLQAEAIKLLVALLFREGGSLNVQRAIFTHLNKPGSDLFFLHIRSLIQDLTQWHRVKGVFALGEDEEPPLPDEIILIRFLQLTCEGHFKPNQDILRNQPLNHHTVNLLDDLVQYLSTLALYPCRTSTVASLSVIATILEVIQGPCEKNQDHFAFNTELIEVLNRRMRSRLTLDCVAEEENELKKTAIEVFQALLEGQGQKKDIYERMLSVVHLNVIKMICEKTDDEEEEEGATAAAGNNEGEGAKEGGDGEGGEGGEGAGEEQPDESDGIEDLQIECLVLLQMLVDYKPSLYKELQLESLYRDRTDIACVEVFWRGQLQRRFYHVPDICSDLAKSSKDEFVLSVNRSSPENKLYGLLDAAKVLHSEIMHQQRLKEMGIASIFSRLNQERSKKLSFTLALIVNGLYLGYYNTSFCPSDAVSTTTVDDGYEAPMPCTDLRLSDSIEIAIIVLNILMLISSGFTLLLFLVVRVPVNYEMLLYYGRSQWQALLLSAMDTMTLYYIGYFCVVFVSVFNELLSPFLLLDLIVLSPVLQEVLQAAWKPRKSIFMSIVLTWVIVYIYAIMVFYQFSGSNVNLNPNNFITMWHVFAEYVRYGSFSGSVATYGDIVTSIVNTHYIVDVLFFVSVFVMWNIVKGITFDQFVEIREKRLARIKDTEEVCFMCGITDKVFNRTIGRDAFKRHIKNEQNLWNYVYYIIAIWEQDKDDDDGLEWQIRRYIAAKDLSWFPMNKAVCLLMQDDVDDELDEYLRTSLRVMEREFEEKLMSFKENLLKSISRVEGALTFQPETDSKSLKSKSASIASLVERKHPHVEHMHPGSEGSAADHELMLGGQLERSATDDASLGDVTEASFGDAYSIVVVVEQVLNLLVPKDAVNDLVCRIECDVSIHNMNVSNIVEITNENIDSTNIDWKDSASNSCSLIEKIPSLGCYAASFGDSSVDPLAATNPTEIISEEERELMIAEASASNKRIVFHGKLGDNIDNTTVSILFLTEPKRDNDKSISKLVAAVDVPIAVLLDAAEAKCKIDILLQQSHGLPVPNPVAVLSVEVIGGDFPQLGLQ